MDEKFYNTEPWLPPFNFKLGRFVTKAISCKLFIQPLPKLNTRPRPCRFMFVHHMHYKTFYGRN
jgi:hypothetical protein